ncbi:hypothetical protein HNQ69_001515 [Bartonella callosciuri]|uniref:Uncharacterized protein n=1 Tax=Bartonella callosciuri TaxID=686223 RepID=A0A840P270_9HYPH|nr:hypothetical protein [Bartonella callosciuri]MBB5074377.1 hypothetical protein [Bartonella callosciuri]
MYLTALTLLCDVETLQSYQRRFAQGNSRSFDATIKAATLKEFHLERALLMAKEVAKTEQHSSALFEWVAEKLSMKVK